MKGVEPVAKTRPKRTSDRMAAKVQAFVARRQEAQDAQRYFYLRAITGPTNHRVTVDGREMLMLASYSYLGLIGHPAIDAAAKEAIDRYGTGAGGVRLLTGTNDLHEHLEARIARFAGRPDACVYSSGYVTNVAIITGLVGPGDLVIMDKLDHASIVDGCLLSGAKWRTYRHNDMDHLAKLLREADDGHGAVLVVADAVFSMDGDILDLPAAAELCARHGARLMVDEAHSVGALGATGKGIEEHFGMTGSIDLKMGTLSKSIPSVGGYVAGEHDVIDFLRHTSRPFIFSAALPPPQAAAALAAFDVIEDEPWRLQALRDAQERLRNGLKRIGYHTMGSATPVIPVLTGSEEAALDLTRELFDRDIFVCPIIHPAVPRGTERLRTTVMATHTEEDIDQALAAFADAGITLGLTE